MLVLARVLTAVVKIALGDDAEGPDGGEHPAFGAVDFVHAIALPHWPALTAAWQVEVLCEHIARIATGRVIPFAAPATAATASLAEVVAVAII